MNFMEIAQARQSCRAYDEAKAVEPEKLNAMLEAARLRPLPAMANPIILPSAGEKQPKKWPRPPWALA